MRIELQSAVGPGGRNKQLVEIALAGRVVHDHGRDQQGRIGNAIHGPHAQTVAHRGRRSR